MDYRCRKGRSKAFTTAEELVLPGAVVPWDDRRGCCKEAADHPILKRYHHQLLERIKSSPFFSLRQEKNGLSRHDSPSDRDISLDLMTRFLLVIAGTVVCTKTYCFVESHQPFTGIGRIPWQNCVGVCSDGAASVTGRHQGIIRQMLDRAPEAEWTYCFLHCKSLAAKKMSPELHEVMDISVKTMNSRCFAKLCEDMEADNVLLLYHSEVRWDRFLNWGMRPSLFSLTQINLLLHITMPTRSSQLNLPTYVAFFFAAEPAEHHIFLLQTKFKLSGENLLRGLRGSRKRGCTCFHFWKLPSGEDQWQWCAFCGFWAYFPLKMKLLCHQIWNPSFWKFQPTAL